MAKIRIFLNEKEMKKLIENKQNDHSISSYSDIIIRLLPQSEDVIQAVCDHNFVLMSSTTKQDIDAGYGQYYGIVKNSKKALEYIHDNFDAKITNHSSNNISGYDYFEVNITYFKDKFETRFFYLIPVKSA